MRRPHRDRTGSAGSGPVRPLIHEPAGGAAVSDGDLTRSWHGSGSARRMSPPRPAPLRTSPDVVPGLVLAGIVTVLVGAGVGLAVLPAASPAVTGTLPRAGAVVAAGIDPEAAPPRRLQIEKLGIDTAVGGLRVQRDGTLQVPDDFDVAGWHRRGTAPGDVGPAVVVGHVDSYEGPAVFYRLRELVPGDRVTVARVDGSQVVFEVYGSETVAKDAFPTDRVYGPTAGAELRLLTCGGAFDSRTRSYTENVVVYLRLLDEPVAS